MTKDELFELFNEEDGGYSFYDIPQDKKPSGRKDLCAFILLDKLAPGYTDIVAATGYGVVYLDVNVDKLASIATPDEVRYLNACGVWYERATDSLFMHV